MTPSVTRNTLAVIRGTPLHVGAQCAIRPDHTGQEL